MTVSVLKSKREDASDSVRKDNVNDKIHNIDMYISRLSQVCSPCRDHADFSLHWCTGPGRDIHSRSAVATHAAGGLGSVTHTTRAYASQGRFRHPDWTNSPQSFQLAEENMTRQNLDLANFMNDKLLKTLEIAESSNIAFEEFREEITRSSNVGFPFWRYVEMAGTCECALSRKSPIVDLSMQFCHTFRRRHLPLLRHNPS